MKTEVLLTYTCACGAVCLATAAATVKGAGKRDSHIYHLELTCFLFFEVCVGLYWPTINLLKGLVVNEEHRSAVYNAYRVPLNALVIAILLSGLSPGSILVCCAVMLAAAALAGAALALVRRQLHGSSSAGAGAGAGAAGTPTAASEGQGASVEEPLISSGTGSGACGA